MSIKVQLVKGEDCSLKEGCAIKLGESNLNSQQFNPISKYYLLEGLLNVEYDGEPNQSITSPYGSTWTDYINLWNYNKNVSLKVANSTLFVSAVLTQGNTDIFIEANSSVIKLDNSNTSLSMNANSFLLIVGQDYMVDSTPYVNQKTRIIPSLTPREITISTQQSCSLVYIEPI